MVTSTNVVASYALPLDWLFLVLLVSSGFVFGIYFFRRFVG
mgnify:CR=1 FL=1